MHPGVCDLPGTMMLSGKLREVASGSLGILGVEIQDRFHDLSRAEEWLRGLRGSSSGSPGPRANKNPERLQLREGKPVIVSSVASIIEFSGLGLKLYN